MIPGQGLCRVVWGDVPSGLRPLPRNGHSWLDNDWQDRGHRGNRPGHGRNVSTPSGFAEGAAPSCPGARARCQRLSRAFSQLLHPSGAFPERGRALFPSLCKYLYKEPTNKTLNERLCLPPLIAQRRYGHQPRCSSLPVPVFLSWGSVPGVGPGSVPSLSLPTGLSRQSPSRRK